MYSLGAKRHALEKKCSLGLWRKHALKVQFQEMAVPLKSWWGTVKSASDKKKVCKDEDNILSWQ